MKHAALLLALALVCACARERDALEQRTDCAPAASDDGLDLEAARAAHRFHALRHELRLLEAHTPGSTLSALDAMLDANAAPCVSDLQLAGRLVFEHEYGFIDGLGARGATQDERGPFRRVQRAGEGGPETHACTSCHWRGGPAGAGALQDNSFLFGDGDRVSSADARNPPALLGVAVIELLAREMSAELARQRDAAREAARDSGRSQRVELEAKGIAFGVLHVSARGVLDTREVHGVDPDLVVRPFGWKGNFATLQEFIAESLALHLGIQTPALTRDARAEPALVGDGPREDPDEDGVRDELSDALLSALIVYLASLPLPVVEAPAPLDEADVDALANGLNPATTRSFLPLWSEGRDLFHELGCASCHQPMLVLNDPVLELNVGRERLALDLSQTGQAPRLVYDAALGGYPVWLFSDLRRHAMDEARASQHVHRGVARALYQTRRLWGVASSGPYFHDGHAPDFDGAIAAHGGEAGAARAAFEALAREQRGALRTYLLSLRRPRRLTIP